MKKLLQKLFTGAHCYPPNYDYLWRFEEENMSKKEITPNNARHSYEYLRLINDAETEDEQIALLKKWGGTTPLNMLLSLNFNEKVKLDLPEGMPPYNRDEETDPDMMTPLASQIGRLKACLVYSQIRKMDKERVFIQVLEQVAAREGDVLIAAKDKSLEEMFPKITAEFVSKVFPQYVVSA